MSKDQERPREPMPTPNPWFIAFAAAWLALGAYNLWNAGSDSVTIFLCTASLITLGVDVGKMIGRR